MRKAYALFGRGVYWLIWPGTWLYLRWSQRTRLLVIYKGEVLVLRKWLSNGYYHLPGGGLHPEEEPAKGVVRELYEETGLTLHEDEVQLLATETYKHAGFRFQCHYFVFKAQSRPVTKHNRLEVTDVDWIPMHRVSLQSCSPEIVRALQLLNAAS